MRYDPTDARPKRRWSLWMDDTGALRANEITPTFGGGGFVVTAEAAEQSESPERECNCLVPYLEGAGQHSPGCSIFTPEERDQHRREAQKRWADRSHW